MAAPPKARAIRPAPFAASPIQQITFSSARTNNPPSRGGNGAGDVEAEPAKKKSNVARADRHRLDTPLAAGLRNIDRSNIRFADPLVTEGNCRVHAPIFSAGVTGR
jgi:hypothetical protein